MEKNTIGKFISALRRASGMTQRELADKLFVSDKTVSRWERDECAPDIALIPIIADLFGVTSDEIIRGERLERKNAPTSERDIEDERAQYQRKKSAKQYKSLLDTRAKKAKNLSLIAIGVALLGIICALICNFAFTRALLGFMLACAFFIGAVIMQLCVTSSMCLSVDEDDEEKLEATRQFNSDCVCLSIRVIGLVAVMLGFVLPLSFVDGYLGLAVNSFYLLCPAFAFVTICITHAIKHLFVLPAFLKTGTVIATEEQGSLHAYRRRKLKVMAIILVIAVAVSIVANITVDSLHPSDFVREYKFDSYEDFKDFVKILNAQSGHYESGDPTLPNVNIDQVFPIEPSDKVDGDFTYSETEYLYDNDDNVLCEYEQTDYISRLRYSFDESSDGLPIYVTTTEQIRAARAVLDTIATATLFVPLAVLAIECVIYLKLCSSRKKALGI